MANSAIIRIRVMWLNAWREARLSKCAFTPYRDWEILRMAELRGYVNQD